MEVFEYGHRDAGIVLIQPVDSHELSLIENEVRAVRALTDKDFSLTAVKVSDWNRELSPWEAPAVFGNEAFGGGADEFLEKILGLTADRSKTFFIGGYSLAGLFALWAVYQTDLFSGAAAASPSVWFPQFTEYMKNQQIRCSSVYLSIGDKEEKTRNAMMSTVGERIREADALLHSQGINHTLEINKGNHFCEPDLRTAKAFAWVMEHSEKI